MPVAITPIDRFKITTNKPIDYKRFTPYSFSWAKEIDNDTHIYIDPDKKGYITTQLTKFLVDGAERKDTSIINIGVGRGKTTSAYEIINHFYSQENFVVIMVAPFKKLVTRDFQAFKNKQHVVHYEMLEDNTVSEQIMREAKIHFITVNTLIGNPGEDNIDITYKKRNYIEQIQRHCYNNKKQVVFLFDELHAAINVFSPQYVMNLWKWRGITHKSYLLSATYTESSKVIIEYIAYLTDYRIKIYETPRTKFATQSKLHLFITMGTYYSDLTILEPLAEVISKAAAEEKRVHIITAYKDLAHSFVKVKEDSLISKAVKELDHNLLTAQTENVFNKTKSNIGTTFHTGINFDHEDDILIVVLPPVMGKPDSKSGGVFTDGKVAINQAVARLRTGGDIYVVMPKPETVIDGEYLDYLSFFRDTKRVNAEEEEKQSHFLYQHYKEKRDRVETEIKEAEKLMQSDEGGNWNDRAPIRYPSYGEFLLENSDNFLVRGFESFGKGYAPYVLWAAFNDQFENTTLNSVSILHHQVDEINIREESIIEDLKTYFEGRIPELIKGKNLHEAYQLMIDALKDTYFKTGEHGKAKIIYTDSQGNKKQYGADDIVWPKPIRKGIINLIHYTVNNVYISIEAGDYTHSMISSSWDKSRYGYEEDTSIADKIYAQLSKMEKLYFLLGNTCGAVVSSAMKSPFKEEFEDSKMEDIPDEVYYVALAIIKDLKDIDPLIGRAQPYESVFRAIDPENNIKQNMPKNWEHSHLKVLTALVKEQVPPNELALDTQIKRALHKALVNLNFTNQYYSRKKTFKLQENRFFIQEPLFPSKF